MKDKQHLISPLAYWLAAGKLDARSVLPAIKKLAEDSPKSLPPLLEALEGETDEVLISLARHLRQTLRKEALNLYQTRRQGLPAGDTENMSGLASETVDEWRLAADPTEAVQTAMEMSRYLAFFAVNQNKAPRLFREVQHRTAKALANACAMITDLVERLPKPWLDRLASAWADDMPGRERVLAQLEERRGVFLRKWLEQARRVVKNPPEPDELESAPAALAARFAAAASRDEKAGLLDLACCWMTPAAAPALEAMSAEAWAADRALWNLTLRFGFENQTWEDWRRWLADQERRWQSEQETFGRLIDHQAPGLLLVLYSQLPDPDPAVLDALVRTVAKSGKPVEPSELFASWSNWAPLHELRALTELAEPAPPVIAPAGIPEQAPGIAARECTQPPPLPRRQAGPAAVQTSVAPIQPVLAEVAPPVPPPPRRPAPVAAQPATIPVQPAVAKVAPPVPAKPSVWEVHIQPFFQENWYIVAGIAMVILGSSLLAYYTWDKHWLVRYTLMPLLLAGFTWSLAWVGDWIEKKSAEFKGTAAILRGAAIGLLPINFMAMALLSSDEKVPEKTLPLLAMALIYLSVFGWGLRKWCVAVDKTLGTVLGGTLLLLNALVAVGPLARTVGHLEGHYLFLCVGAGFYAGFAATVGAIVFFTKKILTRQMADEKRVPWFVAGTLAITFLEVFIWVHGFMRHVPQAPTYALMMILTGWLILYAEGRALQLKESPHLHGGESFLGFGAILLGLLMGFGEPAVRVASFLTAGGVWMYQGLRRRHPLHDWIALTLLGLGVAAVGLLPQYPRPWLPLLGVALALGFGLGGWICGKLGLEAPVSSASEPDAAKPENTVPAARSELAHACRGMQLVALMITALIAPLVQWHYQCEPLGTAGWLLLVAALIGWRAFRDQQVQWLHASMAILALALPYAGFMDVAGHSAHHNSMVFGLAILSWLWLGANWIARKPLLLQARSTVLWLYGILAVAAMLLRVALGNIPPEPLWCRDYMDYSGPLLMMLALIPATYFSRSLVPAGIAVAIMAILFPEMKTNLQMATPRDFWGTGLGSSLWGLALTGLCFVLRPWAFLKDLPEGDRFMDKELLPCRRYDHTLFTWPIMTAAVYLLIKVDTWHLVRNLVGSGIPFKTALALGITGVAWTFTAIYHRCHRAAVVGVHLGWLSLFAGISFGYWHQADHPCWTWLALVMGLLLQGLYWFYRFALEPARGWVRALLTEPTRKVLLVGSAVLSIVCIGVVLEGAALEWTLYGFLAAQVIWHALRTRQWFWGTILFFMAILFPEMKANLQITMPLDFWGTGLGSSLWGLALIGLCFVLRPWAFLKDLPEGDRFMGKEFFPVRRHDHTLFTWPIMAAAVYLLIKVDTWHVVRNLVGSGTRFETALALGITGVAWTFTAIYHRRHRAAVVGVHLGWLCLFAGISLEYWHQADHPCWAWPPLVMGLLLQGLYWFYRFGLEPKRDWVRTLLTEPTRQVLLVGSAVLAIVCMGVLLDGAVLEWTLYEWTLYGFLAAQVIWHALRTRQWFWGTILFFQIWIGLLAFTAPGSAPLWIRVSVEKSLSPTLWLLVGIQLLLVALELKKRRRFEGAELSPDASIPEAAPGETDATPRVMFGILSPVLTPVFVLATVLAALLGLGGLADGIHGLGLSSPQQVLLLGALLLTARAQASNLLALPALLLAYVMIYRDQLAVLVNFDRQLELLATPWRLGLLGLAIVLVTQAGRWMHRRNPKLLAGAFTLPVFTAPSCAWLFWPAIIFSGAAALYHTADPALWESQAQLWTPYLGTLTFALVGLFLRQAALYGGAGFLLLLGNIHLVRVFGGEFLRGHGLSELHLISLGLGITLLQASVLRRTIRSATAISAINRTSLGLAGFILVLLSANYFTAPNLAVIAPIRFIVSGALAWLAGWYFRRAARHPGPGEEAHTDLCEGLYHFGVVVAFWCAALLVPWLRQPLFALVALGLPVIYFYVRAELGTRQDRTEALRYRNSAAVLGFAVLGLYVFNGIFQLVMFPGTPISTQHYHYNAPLILLLGIVLLRLHGLGGTSWLAFYGGLALMTGSYFLLTALPGYSPFDHPMPGAWYALGLGHFWILLSYARSPLRTFIQRLAGLDDAAWFSLRRSWGRCLLAATQGATLWGLMDYTANTFMVAPLLAGAATILIHQGILRRTSLYQIVAGVELAMALHMDFLIPSYLSKGDIIWVILAIWLGLLTAFEILRGKLQPDIVGKIAAILGAFVLAHVLYHWPWSSVGLWGMGLGALLAAWSPIGRFRTAGDVHAPPNPSASSALKVEMLFASLLLWVPVWLVYFSQARFGERGVDAALESWPILASTVAVFLTGLGGRLFPAYWAASYHSWPRSQFRRFDVMLLWLETAGRQVHQVTVWITTAIVVSLQVWHYHEAFARREFCLLILLEAALAVAWFFEGKDRKSMLANYLMQLCAAAFFASIRRQLMLTTSWWSYEYDVFASLAFSVALAGAKQILDLQPRSLRVPMLTTLCALPVIALVWVGVHGLGVNLALMVVGLHSVLFTFLGKDNRESPYNILALGGFVGFILLMFYSKLQLRVLHAYIIPVGMGVLVLQELFKNRIRPDARNWIRLATLMAMLGSAGYYALADTSHAITFNMTMILLCLLSMGLGSVLRIRLYLALGFAGLMVDLVSLLYKVLVLMERSARMTVIGSLVLLIGAILVFGAIYYKTSKARIDTMASRWRLKLAQWQ